MNSIERTVFVMTDTDIVEAIHRLKEVYDNRINMYGWSKKDARAFIRSIEKEFIRSNLNEFI